MLLNDPEWSRWSDREIARRANVHHSFVSKLRSLSTDDSEPAPERKYTNKHGTVSTMHIENIGQAREVLGRVHGIARRCAVRMLCSGFLRGTA